MDVFNLLIWIIVIYMIYLLIETISSLRSEVKEMRMKCIKNVHKNDLGVLNGSTTGDPKDDLKEKFEFVSSLLKKMI